MVLSTMSTTYLKLFPPEIDPQKKKFVNSTHVKKQNEDQAFVSEWYPIATFYHPVNESLSLQN